MSVAASVGAGPYEPGLTLSVRPTWGAPGMGAETLWQDQIHTYMPGVGYDASGIDARLGYGMRLPGGSLLTPFGAYGQRNGSGRRLQMGALVGSLGHMPGAFDGPIQLELSGERYDRPGAPADHRFGMFGVVNLGSSARAHGTATGAESTAMPASVTEVTTGDMTLTDVPAPVTGYAETAPVEVGLTSFVALAASSATADSGFESSPSAVADDVRSYRVDVRPSSTAMAAEPTSGAPVARTSMSAETGGRQTANPAVRYATATSGRVPRPAPVSEARSVDRRPGTIRSNRPPMFSAPDYAFEVPARREGQATTVPLGVVLARDPDGGPVTYSLTAGDWTRFKVDPSSGTITYVGPDLPGTRRYKLQVTARDTGRLTETATVMLTAASTSTAPGTAGTHVATDASRTDGVRAVAAPPRRTVARAATAPPRTPTAPATAAPPTAAALPASVRRSIAAARAPAAARSVSATRPAPSARRNATSRAATAAPRTASADTARTYAGVPVLIDVLENDGDIGGMRIVAVTAPAHGTTMVTNGMVRYAPAPGRRGRDTFTYTVAGADGRTARATVTVMVVG